MFEGNRFFPLTGMPIWKMARSNTVFAVWLPEPLTVATWMLKSLMTGFTEISGAQSARSSKESACRRSTTGSMTVRGGLVRVKGQRSRGASVPRDRVEHALDGRELHPRPALRRAGLHFETVERAPVGEGDEARLALAEERFEGRGIGR